MKFKRLFIIIVLCFSMFIPNISVSSSLQLFSEASEVDQLFENNYVKIKAQIPIRINEFFNFSPILINNDKEIICLAIPDSESGGFFVTFSIAANFYNDYPFYLNRIDVESGEILSSIYLGILNYKEICISESQELLAILSEDLFGYTSIALYSLPSCELLQVIVNSNIESTEQTLPDLSTSYEDCDRRVRPSTLQISPDDKFLIYSSYDYKTICNTNDWSRDKLCRNSVTIWNIKEQCEEHTINLSTVNDGKKHATKQLHGFYFSPDSKKVLCAYYPDFEFRNYGRDEKRGNLLIIDLYTGGVIAFDDGRFDRVKEYTPLYFDNYYKIRFYNNTFMTERESYLDIYSLDTGELLKTIQVKYGILDFFVTNNTVTIVTYSTDVFIYNLDTYEIINTIKSNYKVDGADPYISIDGKTLFVPEYQLSSNDYSIIDLEQGKVICSLGTEDNGFPNIIGVSETGNRLITVMDNFKGRDEFVIYDISKINKSSYSSLKFSDVSFEAWYLDDMEKIVTDSRNILQGYNDGTYKPSKELDVCEFIKCIITARGFSLSNGKNFWAENYINKAIELGYVQEDEFNSIMTDPYSDYKRPITRGEMARIVVRMLEDVEGEYSYREENEVISLIKDYYDIDKLYQPWVVKAYDIGVLGGLPDKTFSPNKSLSRAEAAVVCRRIIEPSARLKLIQQADVSNKQYVDLQKKDIPLSITTENIGELIEYGYMEQDENIVNGKEPLKWRVLSVGENNALLISELGIAGKGYSLYGNFTWEKSKIRKWLNGTFFNHVFTYEERSNILETAVINENNPIYGTNGGNNTTDKVFLLSIAEAEKYFSGNVSRMTKITESAKVHGLAKSDNDNGNYTWWLRSPGSIEEATAVVRKDGTIYENGINSGILNISVRPAIRVKLSMNDTSEDVKSKNQISPLKNVKIGDFLEYGRYEQDNEATNGQEKIVWRVLTVKENRALLISDKALEAIPYDENEGSTTWEDCSLRSWLNNTFINNVFNTEEQKRIIESTIKTKNNPEYGTDGGNDTKDKIFLLSIDEVEEYFTEDFDRTVRATKYAVEKGAYREEEYKNYGNCGWMLRSPGMLDDWVSVVHAGGGVNNSGVKVNTVYCAVRPAMWVELEY
jgi:hypothetical protein